MIQIFIDIFGEKSERLDYIANLNENVATTIINKYELLRGNNKIKNISESIIVYNSGDNEAREAAEPYLFLKHKGILVNELDIIITAIAKANNQQILTKDKDFENFQWIMEIRFLQCLSLKFRLGDFLPKLTHGASRFYGTGLPKGIGLFLHRHEFPTVRGYSSLIPDLFMVSSHNKRIEYLL